MLGFDPVNQIENLWKDDYGAYLQMEWTAPVLTQQQVGADWQRVADQLNQRVAVLPVLGTWAMKAPWC
ncbi:MAG: hypothetical protein NZ821_01985 [Gloeomargarita sp. SKYB31]|nr:hypothetical protein [Gloeomargarita sp. SKYB31]